MRQAAELHKGAEKHTHGGDQQPRVAFEHLDDAPTDKEGEQGKNGNGRNKFHRPEYSPSNSQRKHFKS